MAFELHHFLPMMDGGSAVKKPLTAASIVSPTSGRCLGSSQDDFDVIEGGFNAVVTNPGLIRCGHSPILRCASPAHAGPLIFSLS